MRGQTFYINVSLGAVVIGLAVLGNALGLAQTALGLAQTGMSEHEAWITNTRYQNEAVVWGRPKGLLYGNLPGASAEQRANLYPDKAATYMVANFCLPPGTRLRLDGQYPHARYFSITVANQLGDGQLGEGDFLRGDHLVPDPGSSNPFWPWVARNVSARNFTAHVVHGYPPTSPSDRPPNTLYSQTNSTQQRVHLSLRTYWVDRGYDGTGNVRLAETGPWCTKVPRALPVVRVVAGDQELLAEGPAALRLLEVRKTGDPNGYLVSQWIRNVAVSRDPVNAPCGKDVGFEVFWNTDYSVTGAFEATSPEQRVRDYPPSSAGGFANNPDTRYMVLPYSFEFGNVLVLRGKMPTHPVTRWLGDERVPASAQVQYFSVTTAAAPGSGESWDTAADEEIPVDSQGYYTIVVSWPWCRPANATEAHGVRWLSPGAGEGHYVSARGWVGVVFMRFQNPRADWEHSPTNIPMPSVADPVPQDRRVMGPYYPTHYYAPCQLD